MKRFADDQIAATHTSPRTGTPVATRKASASETTMRLSKPRAERRESDAVQGCHWTISLLKRWLIGTHAGAVRDKRLQAYLGEVRVPPQPPQDQRRRPDRRPRDREPSRKAAADDASHYRRHPKMPMVRFKSGATSLS